MGHLRRNEVVLRVGITLGAAICLWAAAEPWELPFTHRVGDVLQYDLLARTAFEVEDKLETQQAIARARNQARYVFIHRPENVVNLRSKLLTKVLEARSANGPDNPAWKEFQPAQATPEMKLVSLAAFQQALDGNERWSKFLQAVDTILEPLRTRGMLKDTWSQDLSKRPEDAKQLQKTQPDATHVLGNQNQVDVYPADHKEERVDGIPVAELEVQARVNKIEEDLRTNPATAEVSGHVFYWLRDRLRHTLEFDAEETEKNKQAAVAAEDAAGPKMKPFQPRQPLALAGEPISVEMLDLLKKEHEHWLAAPLSRSIRVMRAAAMFGLIAVVFAFFALYLYSRQPHLWQDLHHLAGLYVLVVAAVFAANWLSREEWRPEIVPLVLCGLTVAIAFNRELALLVATAVTGIVVLASGQSVSQLFVLLGAAATAVLLIDNIRSRVRLIQICTMAGLIACLLAMIFGLLDGRTLDGRLVSDSVLLACWTLVAGFLVTGLLPFIERSFGVLTDLSLLELSDVSHPLLQELVRRAPGTYNHSINVGSLSEAAAEAIGGRGLLVRVGAYFHDIGKMLKPAYYVENQGHDNRHETLAPAMSTLIIIAHIKDGADLARRHHLPQAIIDFIEQHHGTTLVEYFYRRAEKERQANDAVVEEGAFRYPGPKPQTKEAAVLMLADAVESASRTLEDPAPARIEGLVEDIVMKRLMDDQFDECPINLHEIRVAQHSLVKSLIAVYHGRVKYPTQKTA
jgi:putative nucleotidyltransferase with HDIG domain